MDNVKAEARIDGRFGQAVLLVEVLMAVAIFAAVALVAMWFSGTLWICPSPGQIAS